MFKAERTTEKRIQKLTAEEELSLTKTELAATKAKQEEQATRLSQMEEDNIAFQDFVLSNLGGI